MSIFTPTPTAHRHHGLGKETLLLFRCVSIQNFKTKTICTQINSRHILITCSSNIPFVTTLPIRGNKLSFWQSATTLIVGWFTGPRVKNHNNNIPNRLKYRVICTVYTQYIILKCGRRPYNTTRQIAGDKTTLPSISRSFK